MSVRVVGGSHRVVAGRLRCDAHRRASSSWRQVARRREPRRSLLQHPQPGFPASWRNPLNVANPNSGAVMAGAGNPPSGTHGFAQYGGDVLVDRARCNFSNYGARVDAQGWGGSSRRPDTAISKATSLLIPRRTAGTRIVLRHVERLTHRGRGACVRAGGSPGTRAHPTQPGTVQGAAASNGFAAGRWPGKAPDAAHRQSTEPPSADPGGAPDGAASGCPVHRNGPGIQYPHVVHVPVAGSLARRVDRRANHSEGEAPAISWVVRRAGRRCLHHVLHSITNHGTEEVGIEALYALLGW